MFFSSLIGSYIAIKGGVNSFILPVFKNLE